MIANDYQYTLSPEARKQMALSLSFAEIMALPSLERAEVLEYLYDFGNTRVSMKSADAEIPFRIDSRVAGGEIERFVIPGKADDPSVFPLRVAVYVASSLDQPQFGGRTFRMADHRDPDGVTPIVTVPERPDLIKFEMVRE